MLNKLSELSARLVPVGLCAFATFLPFNVAQAEDLSLPQATTQLVLNHPELKQFAWRLKAVEAEQDLANQRPTTHIGLETSEVLGSSEYSEFKSAETTLSISSVFELGNKRQQRLETNQARQQQLKAEQEAQALTLLSALTQQFVRTLALQEQCDVKQQGADLAQQAFYIVQERVKKAAAPENELLRAKVALIQAKLANSNCLVEHANSMQLLAQRMGKKTAQYYRVTGNLFALPQIEPIATLDEQLQNSPLLKVYAQQIQVQQHEINQAKASNSADIQWSVGVTHFAATDDAALGLGIEVPLFSGSRNRPQVARLQAQSNEISIQQQLAEQALFNELYVNSMQHSQNILTVQSLRYEAVPLLERAYQQAQNAYQQGRYSYSEWVNAGQELLAAKSEAIKAAESALINQAVIEGLIGGAK